MQLKRFAFYLERLEKTSGRIEITNILSELFAEVGLSDIDKVTYLSLGTLAPNYEGVILNLAEKMMVRVLSKAYSEDEEFVKQLIKNKGDVGDAAQELAKRLNLKGNGLSIEDVFESLMSIAKDAGEGSQEKKIDGMVSILTNIDPLSARFVARIPVGRLRLGFSEKTIIDALSEMSGIASNEIENAFNIRPDIGYISRLVKEKNIKKAKPEVGVPVVPMLAQRLNSATEMVKKMGEVAVEPKFDGLRIFIHYRKPDFLKIFTRNMNSIDIKTFPELKNVGKYIKANKVILDTEAIGIDEKREMFLDFQKTIQRRRKHNVAKTANEVPLQFQVFDMIFVDGNNLMTKPYIERRKALSEVVAAGGPLKVDESTITKDPQVIRNLHKKYLKMGLEGVVVKKANAGYVSGRTGWNWVKMKEEEGKTGKLSDTIDCVIMGYTSGKGKRVGFGVGQFLAGVRDGDSFKTVTKVGTGLTDEQFRGLKSRLSKIVVKEKPKGYEVEKDLIPDYWVVPQVVVELAADEITVSPKHTAGMALRFPRLVKFRDEKDVGSATTLKEVKDIYNLQKSS